MKLPHMAEITMTLTSHLMYQQEIQFTWPSSSFRLDVRAIAAVSVGS